MENMQYAEELVREFLVFRGFTNTLQAFDSELSTDIGKGFQVDKIMDLIFSVYVPKFQAEKLVGLFSFFKQCLSSSSETVLLTTLSKLEVSILRYYVVSAIQSGRRDKVLEFFGMNGNDLLRRGQDWAAWFAIPYVKKPNSDPEFRIYFSKEWYEALRLSVRNFFSEIFNGTRMPALLKINSEKTTVNRLKKDIKQLNLKLSELQALLEEKDGQLWQLRSNASSLVDASTEETKSSSSVVYEENHLISKDTRETCPPATFQIREAEVNHDWIVAGPAGIRPEINISKSDPNLSSQSSLRAGDGGTADTIHLFQDGPYNENGRESHVEDFPEVKVDFQETFLGHTSPITRCRFSASGNNIASASEDGTVRIWTYDSSTPASRNATIYCGAKIMSLDWECKSDRLLLIGTADGGIKAWNVDAKRVVCDLNTSEAFPSVLDIKCSPVEPIFVSAAASKGHGSSHLDSLGFASLTVWNMKTWKAMTVLPLGKDPPAITSLSFNHNGKILAAAATDGMIHMFDMSAGLQITGWPAHDSAISSILFGPDETSIFSLGVDGKVLEWSLQNQGQILWSRNCSRFCDPESSKNCRHEMALDANGRRLLVTSGLVRAPIYQVRGHAIGLRTLPHSAAITTVDWHPTLPLFVTGSADNSVRVTSMS
ncbi:WD repeat-containing protein 91 homolog [Prunus dulcis]|uniref:WD repeat-containing protein 91 homolog n=1 Tax=Prunus dulcis TaxID=3755 RepID=UPI0014824E3F|nr:WD repeat-containing protein 91 homolog [Prunus dulcis]XP_034205441.1 WD repeat-containing protein 91 homolog [Prunus dulcis]XP_034205442.1 WD repeat-containing protein 91 homolog [Prunus dulcis]